MKTQLYKGGNVVIEVETPMIFAHADIVKYGNEFYYFNTVVRRVIEGGGDELINCYNHTDQIWNLHPEQKSAVKGQ